MHKHIIRSKHATTQIWNDNTKKHMKKMFWCASWY